MVLKTWYVESLLVIQYTTLTIQLKHFSDGEWMGNDTAQHRFICINTPPLNSDQAETWQVTQL